jgi:hypothetical protein
VGLPNRDSKFVSAFCSLMKSTSYSPLRGWLGQGGGLKAVKITFSN